MVGKQMFLLPDHVELAGNRADLNNGGSIQPEPKSWS